MLYAVKINSWLGTPRFQAEIDRQDADEVQVTKWAWCVSTWGCHVNMGRATNHWRFKIKVEVSGMNIKNVELHTFHILRIYRKWSSNVTVLHVSTAACHGWKIGHYFRLLWSKSKVEIQLSNQYKVHSTFHQICPFSFQDSSSETQQKWNQQVSNMSPASPVMGPIASIKSPTEEPGPVGFVGNSRLVEVFLLSLLWTEKKRTFGVCHITHLTPKTNHAIGFEFLLHLADRRFVRTGSASSYQCWWWMMDEDLVSLKMFQTCQLESIEEWESSSTIYIGHNIVC